MSLPDSLLAYNDCMDFMEKAMDSPTGMRMYFRDDGEALRFRMRCYYARKLHRKDSKEIYQPGEPMWGKSPYDPLLLTIKRSDDGWWVYAKQMVLDTSRVEPIPEEEYAPIEIEAEEVRMIEDQTERSS